jgi:CHASE2 domain-containing sensor protein
MEQLIGAVGFLLLVAALGLNVAKRMKRYSIEYNGLNLVGSLLLCYYAFWTGDGLFEVVFAAWALIAAVFLLKRLVDKDMTHEISDLDVDSRNWKFK